MVDQIEELEPSTDSEIPQDEEVLSSSAESETEEDLLSVVQDAMQMSTTDEGSQPEETETEEDNEFIASTEDSSDEDESFEDVPFNKHPRFKKLIEERNSYKQGANQYNQIQSFLDQNSVSADEAATGLQIMALMKNNPAEALKALQPYVENLSVVTGSKIPQDIQSKVDDGYLDEDAARELSVSRMEAQRQKQMREQLEQQNAASTEQQNKSYLAQTVTTWEEKTRHLIQITASKKQKLMIAFDCWFWIVEGRKQVKRRYRWQRKPTILFLSGTQHVSKMSDKSSRHQVAK